jgi:hypothetical protein
MRRILSSRGACLRGVEWKGEFVTDSFASGLFLGSLLGAALVGISARRTFERVYTVGVLGQIDVARRIRLGRSEELVSSVDEALPGYLNAIYSEFGRDAETDPVFVSASQYYREFRLELPSDLTPRCESEVRKSGVL